jgi:hypothetical protein
MAAVNIGTIETVLGMTGLTLEKAGYSDAVRLVKDSFVAECTVWGVKISGAAILSEQRQVLSRYAKEGVVLYRGPDALAWENLNENKCVKPGCNSMLLARGRITKDLIAMLSNWRHSGFQVFCGNRISPQEETAMENLAQYLLRVSFLHKRMTCLPD